MKTVLAVIAAAFLLSGCPELLQKADIPVSQTLPAPAQEVQKMINEANILITASANVVAQNLKDGVMTQAENDSYAVQLRQIAAKVDSAQSLLRLGDFTNARSQAETMQRAISALHREVASRARRPQ